MPCTGDCDGDDIVEIDELVIAVDIVLGQTTPDACPGFGHSRATIGDLVTAVANALNGC